MGNSKETFLNTRTAVIAAALGAGAIYAVCRHRNQIIQSMRYIAAFRNPLRHKHIQIIETVEDCQSVVSTLKKHCSEYQVLGFDCEWVTVGGTRRPTALLQLASHNGLCALFRLCLLQKIPQSLRELLEDENIIKVGVDPQNDASQLCSDFGVGIASTLDLRFLAVMIGRKPEGLAKMSASLLNVYLDKNWRLVCSNWEAELLTQQQIEYAANDALVAVEIFKKFSYIIKPRYFWENRSTTLDFVKAKCEHLYEIRFREGFSKNVKSKKTSHKTTLWCQSKRLMSTRSRKLYDNCYLQAPDGELLCTIDRKKAQWYIDQSLGSQVDSDTFTVRLNFEPAGRAVGEVGRYYQSPKQNCCVVCGTDDVYSRKNVVPREYRIHFPVVMKSHTSHDILLLCPTCHQRSNIFDLNLRRKFAKMCEAPLDDKKSKFVELPELRKIKCAARALLNAEKIPEKRQEELRNIVLKFFPGVTETDLTQEMINEAANVEPTQAVNGYCPHGLKVAKYFQTNAGGLIELERLWREHFLQTMKPKYLPDLWNVNHNANRLEIRANEGRIDNNDLVIAGLSVTSPVTPMDLTPKNL